MPHYDANISLILRVYLVTFILHSLGRGARVEGYGSDHSIAAASIIILRIWSLPSVVNSP